jgi:hypothetical protein
MAIERFKYPRVSLEIEEVDNSEDMPVIQFKEELTNAEI